MFPVVVLVSETRPLGHSQVSLPVVLLCLIFAGLAYGQDRVIAPDAEALQAKLEALVEQPFIAGAAVTDPAFMWRLYARREFNPAWDSTAKINALLEVIDASARHGLNPDDYHRAQLRALLANGDDEAPATKLEILASDAVARLAFHLHFGKLDPRRFSRSWNYSRSMRGLHAEGVVEALLLSEDLAVAVESMAPPLARYQALRRAMYAGRVGPWSGDPVRRHRRFAAA